MIYRRFALALALLGCLVGAARPTWAAAAAEQRIAAVINDDVVSVRDLQDRLDLVLLTSGVTDRQQASARLAPQVLRSLIEETLQLQEAERLNITVDDGEIQQALANIAERNQMSVETMEGFLRQNGINLNTLMRQLRAQIAWVKVVNLRIRPRVSVTVDQLDLAVQEARRNQGQPEYLLSEIILPVDTPDQADKVAEDAGRLVQTLREGASFASLARQMSAAASAARGGDVGWVRASTIPAPLLQTLDALQPGEVSEPISSPIGYHIYLLRDRRIAQQPQDAAARGVEVRLAHILFPLDNGTSGSALETLREQAAALRPRLQDCAAMAAAAAELDAPGSGDLGWMKVADLAPNLAKEVLDLPVGEVSAPFQAADGIHLLMVCERREPEQATPERDEIAQRLERERLDRLARRYLRDLRKNAFVEVRL